MSFWDGGGDRAAAIWWIQSIVDRFERLGRPPRPLIFLALCSWNALLAVLLGKELNWDLQNYHFCRFSPESVRTPVTTRLLAGDSLTEGDC
jgi:hypothetical protein